ncbi:hypothetical protein PENTCL1PPCAC_989, partial [Pristionchus entomophagus]
GITLERFALMLEEHPSEPILYAQCHPLSTSMMSLLLWIRIFTTSRQTSCLRRSQRNCSQDSGPGDGGIGRSQYSPSSSRAGFLHNSCYHEERQPVFR